jgi:hypothetical protein
MTVAGALAPGHAERLRPPPFFGSTFWFKHGGGKMTWETERKEIS